jgi:hypothetical protein
VVDFFLFYYDLFATLLHLKALSQQDKKSAPMGCQTIWERLLRLGGG